MNCYTFVFNIRYEMGRKGAISKISGIKLLAVTVKHIFQWKQLLILPITVFIGAEMGFIAADFTVVSLTMLCKCVCFE